MIDINTFSIESLSEACSKLTSGQLPEWNRLPDLDIYMDQLISLIKKYLTGYPGIDEKGITSSMVNNYVKLGLVPAPTKKKYNRPHIACLIMISILKQVLPIGVIKQLISPENRDDEAYKALYELFRTCAADTGEAVSSAALEAASQSENSKERLTLCAALRAQAEQALAQELIACEET